MSIVNPRYVINTELVTGELNLFVDSLLITTSTYETNEVTLQETEDPIVSNLIAFKENLDASQLWISLIKRELGPPRTQQREFAMEIEKNGDNVKGKYTYEGTQMADIEFTPLTGVVLFQPRPEITFPFEDYIEWT